MRPQKNSTQNISINTAKCEACWECLDKCETDTLGRVNFWFHRHVVIRNPGNCCGCEICIDVCPNDVFEQVRIKSIRIPL